jgi:hypothetical protein
VVEVEAGFPDGGGHRVTVREVCSKDLSKGGHTVATLHDADLTEVVSTLSTPEVTTFIRDLVRTAF